MEKPSDHIEKFTKETIKNAGLEKPGDEFLNSVMDRIETTAEKSIRYKPLIPKGGWIFLAAALIGCMVLLYMAPSDGNSFLDKMEGLGSLQWNNLLADIELSNTMVYALACLGLFLLQIPLLKRYVVNNRS